MKTLNNKKLIISLLFIITIFTISMFTNLVNATEIESAYTATKTSATLGAADGIKDEAYNNASPIPVSVVANQNGNENPATANMYILWDNAYLYVYAEVLDTNHYGYLENEELENRDAFEIMFDLYHKADYYIGGYGGEYRNEWYGTGANMCEGFYKIAAGIQTATVDKSVQGTHWMWDDQKNNGSYYSGLTETGYSVEMKISVGRDANKYLTTGREIGVGVKVYDKYTDDENTIPSVTTIESKNLNQEIGPRYLSNVVLVEGDTAPAKRDEVVLQGRDAYVANKTSEFIIADGIKDEAWFSAQAIDLCYVRQFANENVGKMTIYMLWDEDYFYLFAEIEDNTPNVCPGSDIFNYNNYDSVGFCLDLLRNTNANNFDTGNYKTSVSFGGNYRGDKMCEGFWAVTRGSKDLTIGTHWMCDDSTTKLSSSFGSVSTSTGYTVEMKLYAGNNKTEFMQEGRKIGVGLNVSDQFVEGGNTSGTVAHAVLDAKNFPNNDRAWGKVWAQGPCALSEVELKGYSEDNTFESDNVERKDFNASRVLSDTKIKVDGVMDEVYNTTSEIQVNTLVKGSSNATAKARVMWTKGYLYVFVDVNDTTLSEIGLANTSDSVTVAVDLLGDNSVRNNRWGASQTKNGEGIFVCNAGGNTFGYGTRVLYERYLSRVASVIKEDGSGYTVEMRIELGDNINTENDIIGLAILLNDNTDGTNDIINGIVSTNTQQDKVFIYSGVLDNLKLISNSSETKSEIKDADSMDYIEEQIESPTETPEATPTPEVSETPIETETPEVTPTESPEETPEVTPTPEEDNTLEEKGGCKGSISGSITLLLVLISMMGILSYRKNKLGRKGE